MCTLILYGTSNCHLCEQAKTILRGMCLAVENIDIAVDGELLIKYGTLIPVLRRADNDDELCWPFDAADVTRFLF